MPPSVQNVPYMFRHLVPTRRVKGLVRLKNTFRCDAGLDKDDIEKMSVALKACIAKEISKDPTKEVLLKH